MLTRTLKLIAMVIAMAGVMTSCGGGGEGDHQATPTPDVNNAFARIPTPLPHYELKLALRKYAIVSIDYKAPILSLPERAALAKLVEAGELMNEIFFVQCWNGNHITRQILMDAHKQSHADPFSDAGKNHDYIKDIIRFYKINFGPWDRIDNNRPWLGDVTKPPGANFYPEGMTAEDFEQHIASTPQDEEAFRSFFTVIRDESGVLTAIPYSQEYSTYLQRASALLYEAADILTNPENQDQYATGVDYTTLATFLRSRADAFLSNDYYQSDMDWMDVKNNIIDVTIGPYEVYEDELFGYKASFEAFIGIRDPADSKRLAGMKNYLQELENALPIPDEHKNPNRGSESPVSVVDLVFAGGETAAGVQTIAFNLPNDERVREAKGSKKVMLKNISEAKFREIMTPIANRLLDMKQLEYLDFDAYFNNVLMHELAHGLGPGTIKKNGKETTVSLELKELYPSIEEAKADIVGLYCRRYLVGKGFFPKGSDVKGYISFLPGFFRAIRFGASSAHGKANMMEFNFLREQGAISFDETGRTYHVNVDKMPAAVEALSRKLLMIEAKGDYAEAKAFLDKYAVVSDDVERSIKKLDGIPVDIDPQYKAEQLLQERKSEEAL